MSTSYLYSERHFRLYESYLKTIVDSWPEVSIFTPRPPVASVETLSSRIRMAREALRANIQSNEPLWETSIDKQKFLLMCDEFVVSTTIKPGKVVCGPVDKVRAMGLNIGPIEAVVEQVIPKVNLDHPSEELLYAVLTLHHYRLLSEPSIVVTDLTSVIQDFASSHDIAVQRNGDTFTIL